jgi:hypothetical protein
MNPITRQQRRTFLGQSCRGVGALALSSLFQSVQASGTPGVLAKPHLPVKAKRVIFLVMAGGPSHLELYDNKPVLAKQDGKPMPESFTKGQPIAQLQGAKLTCLGPQWGFKKHGKSGRGWATRFNWGTYKRTGIVQLCGNVQYWSAN